MSAAAPVPSKAAMAKPMSNASHSTLVLQRKCACGSPAGSLGGECSECSKTHLQTKLTIGRSDDPLEQEADRVAEQVMRAPADTAVRATPPNVQRYTNPDVEGATVPDSVDHVLAGAGLPLETALRQDMEHRFGHDFSRVRVHRGGAAEQSAREVGAHAYTVGNDIVFAERQYAPATHQGRQLIAHELTHVMQQTSEPADVGPVNEGGALPPVGVEQVAASPVLARRPASPMFVPPPNLASPPHVESESLGEMAPSPGGALQAGQARQQLYAYNESFSFEMLYKKAKEAADPEGAQMEMERPVSTLRRGGTPPTFVTAAPKSASTWIGGGPAGSAGNIRVTYTPHWFHVLDAIESDVAAATTSEQLIDIFRAYFPDTVLRLGTTIAARTSHGAIVSLKWGTEFQPTTLDPGGSARSVAFLQAVNLKPRLSTDLLIQVLIQEWDQAEKQNNERRKRRQLTEDRGKECRTGRVGRTGDPDHNDYATEVTGANDDFQIVAPDGVTQCTTDGRDERESLLTGQKTVWEVKTRHEWATSYGIGGAIFAPYFSGRPTSHEGPNATENMGRVGRIEEQRQRCLEVTDRCGFRYAYAFETEEAANFMRNHWAAGPPVYHRARR